MIGRLDDIERIAPNQTFHRLNVQPFKKWKPEVNDLWLQGLIDARKPVKLVSPVHKTTLKNPVP